MASLHEIFNGSKIAKRDCVTLTEESAQFFRRDFGVDVWPGQRIFFTGVIYSDKKGQKDPLYEFKVDSEIEDVGDRIVIPYDSDILQM